MSRSAILTSFFLILSLGISAQNGFKEGYVLKTSQDTVYGLIENRGYYFNSLNCNFKAGVNDDIIHYEPSEIYGYRFTDGKYYVSKMYGSTIYFFEYLYKGRLNLYFKQTSDLGNQYFIDRDDLPVMRLLDLYEKPSEDSEPLKINEYSGHNLVLAYYTSDDPLSYNTALAMKGISPKSLTRFAENYNNAFYGNEPVVTYKKKVKIDFEFEMNGGISNYYKTTNNPSSPKTFPTLGPVVSMMVPNIGESVYLGLGINFNYLYPKEIWVDEFYDISSSGDSLFRSVLYRDYKKELQLPVSVFYKNHHPGLSPYFGFSSNLLHIFNIKAIGGASYQVKSVAFRLYGEYEIAPTTENTFMRSVGVKFGLAYLINGKKEK